MITPMVVRADMPRMKNTPRLMSAKKKPGARGMAAMAPKMLPSTSAGASTNSTRSAPRGIMSSFINSFTPSAMDCAQPCQPPTYIGP